MLHVAKTRALRSLAKLLMFTTLFNNRSVSSMATLPGPKDNRLGTKSTSQDSTNFQATSEKWETSFLGGIFASCCSSCSMCCRCCCSCRCGCCWSCSGIYAFFRRLRKFTSFQRSAFEIDLPSQALACGSCRRFQNHSPGPHFTCVYGRS
jgi:hypothetical protein